MVNGVGIKLAIRFMRRYMELRGLHARPGFLAGSRLRLIHDQWCWGSLGTYVWYSRQIPSWTRGAEAVALARTSQSLPNNAVIVEIGAFLGGSTVLLAGARKLQGSGTIHSIDPFDASGDAFSVPIYHAISGSLGGPLRQCFEENIDRAGLAGWVEVHQGRAVDVAATWSIPVDLLFMDGDHSYAGVRSTHASWSPFLKPGGIIAVHNSRSDVPYAENHDGSMRLVKEVIHPPQYDDVRCIGSTTFARKVGGSRT